MGLFSFLRGKDEKAIPDPGTPEFEAMVQGSAIPDAQSVTTGQPGWKVTGMEDVEVKEGPTQTLDLRGTGAREKVEEVLRAKGIDPDKQGQTIDASTVPGLKEAIFSALGSSGIQIPNAEGFGGGISAPKQDPLAQVEYLAKKRDAGEITDAEFEAQKKKVLGE
jgi:hypothetical protein